MRRGVLGVLLVALCCSAAAYGQSSNFYIPDWVYDKMVEILDRAESGDLPGAVDDLYVLKKKMRRGSAAHATVVRELGTVLIRAGRYADAQAELEAVVKVADAGYANDLRFQLAQAYLLQDKFIPAEETLRTFLDEAEEPPPHAYFLAGYAAYRRQGYVDAIGFLETANAMSAKPRGTWVELLAFSYLEAGRGEDAVMLLKRTIEQAPAQTRWWRYLARFLFAVDDIESGAASMAIASMVAEAEAGDVVRLARLYAFIGVPESGARLLEAALESGAVAIDYDRTMLLAECWLLAREFERAVATLEVAGSLTSQAEPFVTLGQLYMHWEQYENALRVLDIAVDRGVSDGEGQLYYLLGLAAYNLTEFGRARAALEQASTDASYGRSAKELLTRLD